jgi:hypothetical protein
VGGGGAKNVILPPLTLPRPHLSDRGDVSWFWKGASRRTGGARPTPPTPSVKEFICDSADSFFRHYHNRVLDQLVLLSITPSFMKIFRSRFGRACTRTVANVPQNYNSLGWWVGGKMGVRKKKKKKFFPATFLPLSQHDIVDTWGLRS